MTPHATLGFQSTPISTSSLVDILRDAGKSGKLDDLEGIAVDSRDYAYAVTSHSRTESGKRKSGREKLIRFRLDGNDIVDLKVYNGLFDAIASSHPSIDRAARARKVKDGEGLNIEGLSLDASGQRLLVA